MESMAGSQRSMRASSIFVGSARTGAAGVSAQATVLKAAAINRLAAEARQENFNMKNPFVSYW
jgi:hypothetical protein